MSDRALPEGEVALKALVFGSLDEALKALPQSEQDRYEQCQQSVIDARRAAPANEGRNVIL
jgi:hypothetical protein